MEAVEKEREERCEENEDTEEGSAPGVPSECARPCWCEGAFSEKGECGAGAGGGS